MKHLILFYFFIKVLEKGSYQVKSLNFFFSSRYNINAMDDDDVINERKKKKGKEELK